MDLGRIMALIDILATTPLIELEVEDASGRVRLLKRATALAPAALPSSEVAAPGVEPAPEARTEGLVLSPVAGTFYRAAAPNDPPIVSEGDRVETGQPLALVEAMKTLCSIAAARSGRVRRVLVANGAPVVEGEPLFEIE